jgi:hypothetical protein
MKLQPFILTETATLPFQNASRRCVRHLFAIFALLLTASVSKAGTPSTAIILFDGPNGPAYVQATGITVNGKTELRVCDAVEKFDKRAFDLLPRTQLAGATSLERTADGALTMTVAGKQVCVVPANLRFEKNAELTPRQAADQAVIQGTSVSTDQVVLPEFKPGVRLVFVPAPDADLAEFLRTQRANSISEWQEFLHRFPSSAHVNEARTAMADLHQRDAEAAWARYQESTAAHKPNLMLLKQASTQAQAALRIVPGFHPAFALTEAISRELDVLLARGRTGLEAYRQALQSRSAGYLGLVAAREHVDRLLEIRSDYTPVVNLRRDITAEEQKVEEAIGRAESLVAARHYDEAAAELSPYASFMAELPRIATVFTADYRYHLNQGQAFMDRQDWKPASDEFRKALSILADSRDAAELLKRAETNLVAAQNQQAAHTAVLQSNDYAAKGEYIDAYNSLAELPDAQRALVAAQISALSPNFVAAASHSAQKLQETHLPIKSRADEDAIRQASDLLDHASALTRDPSIRLKRDFLCGKLSAFYVDQAKKRLEKPLGAGAGLGWLYLQQAERYDANVGIVKDQVKDLMAAYSGIYQRRARLSVGIVLRDQTSRQNSAGFADQVADALASSLDPAMIQVDILRQPVPATDSMQPNFLLVGEILEHRVVKNSNLETLTSKYRAGTHEVKNPEWIKVNSDYEEAQQQVAAAQRALDEARAQHKKKELIAAANAAVEQAQQHAEELRHKVESTAESRLETVVEPYSYTRRTVDLTAAIHLSFHITDSSGAIIEPATSLRKDNHQSAVILENVKPEDTEGVTNKTVEPDEQQFMADLEITARDALLKAVREKAAGFPAFILQEARNRAQHGDLYGAAEEYVLYLNATPASSSQERMEGAKFLHDQFNLPPPATAAR